MPPKLDTEVMSLGHVASCGTAVALGLSREQVQGYAESTAINDKCVCHFFYYQKSSIIKIRSSLKITKCPSWKSKAYGKAELETNGVGNTSGSVTSFLTEQHLGSLYSCD